MKKKKGIPDKETQPAGRPGGESKETLDKCKSKDERLQKQFYAITRIRDHKGFSELNIAGVQRDIHKLQDQINGLRKANKELDSLKAQLVDIQQKKEEAEQQRGQHLIDETRLKDRVEQYQQQQESHSAPVRTYK